MAEGVGDFLSQEQLAALGSPARGLLADILLSRGAMTVADLAKHLGRSPKGLYYHLRELERVGLVRSEMRRGESGREEAVYQMTARPLRINPLAGEEYRAEMKRGIRMILRRVAREHNRWIDSLGEHPEWRGRGALMRARLRVPPEIAIEAVRRMEELGAFLRDNEDPEGITMTQLLAIFPSEDPGESSGGNSGEGSAERGD
jgi:predicted ArsR family transcriptional regulator